MARFKGAQTFVEDCSHHFTEFYNDVGQNLSKWIAKAPKIKEKDVVAPTTISAVSDIIVIEDDEVIAEIAHSL